MKVWSDYRVTIPVEFRRRLGFHPGTAVDFIVRGDNIEIVKVSRESTKPRKKEGRKSKEKTDR